MAVEESAAMQPKKIPSDALCPLSRLTGRKMRMVAATCAVPPRNTGFFRRESSAPDISRPMVNMSMTTPVSARSSTAFTFSTSPNAVGPHSTPVMSSPTMEGSRSRQQTSSTRRERQNMRAMSGRRGISMRDS